MLCNSFTCSDVQSTKDNDSTKSADEVDGIYEMLDDETSFDQRRCGEYTSMHRADAWLITYYQFVGCSVIVWS